MAPIHRRNPTHAVLLFALALLMMAGRADAEQKPQLVLDTGGHMGLIRAIAFTPDGRQIVSAGDDKVIRIWDVAARRTVRTIRGFAGAGNEGKIYAMALSPDGRTIAVGGWLGPFAEPGERVQQPAHWIRLHDFQTGAVRALLKGHTDIVNALAFSPDGRSLLSGSADKTAIIWDVERAAPRDRLEGHGAFVSSVAFTPDGSRAITGSFDKAIRIWDVMTGTLMAKLEGHTQPIRALAVARDGTFASGDLSGDIRLWSSETAVLLRPLAKQGGDVPALAFASDGNGLLAGRGPGSDYSVNLFDADSGAVRASYQGHDGIVLAVTFSPDGKFAASAGGTGYEIAIWNPATGEAVATLEGAGTNFAAVGFAADGSAIAWGTQATRESPFGRGELTHELTLPLEGGFVSDPQPLSRAPGGYVRGKGSKGVWSLTQAAGGPLGYPDAVLEIRRGGAVYGRVERTSSDGYRHRAYTLTPDGSAVISGGGNGVLAAYDLEGRKIGDFTGHDGEVWSVAVSPDGRFLVSGASDQTLRLWNVETRELILTLFQGQDGNWIAWTPQGYYTSSPQGDRSKAFSVGWLVSKGVGDLSDYIQAGQLKEDLLRSDVVSQAIQLASAKKALGEAVEADFKSEDLITRQPPRFAVLEPADGQEIAAEKVPIRLEFQDPSAPPTEFSVIVNSAQITGGATRGFERIKEDGQVREIEIPLDQYENRVQIRAVNEIGQFFKELVLYNPALKDKPKVEDKPRGRLFLLAIGVDTYQNRPKQDQLRFAAADAKAFRDSMLEAGKGMYREVKAQVIATGGDKPPTRANIVDALDTFFLEAAADDTVVLFLAGHGVNEGKDYFFMPQDVESLNGRWRVSTAVNWYDIQRPFQNAAGRRVMFVDTCHSQQAFNPRMMGLASDAEVVVFSATDAKTLAIEDPALGHGIFTFALLDGVGGNADFGDDGIVNVFELNLFVSQEVTKRTQGKQRPAFHSAGTDFALAAK